LVLSFLCGAYACGLLIDKNQVHFMGKAFYGLALILNSSLLATAAFIPGRLLPVCLVAAACGLQNAMCTSHFGAIIRTTHVTGTVTDIGSTLGRISMIYIRKGCRCSKLDDVERAEVGVDARKLGVLFGLWSFYFMGGLFGVYMEPWNLFWGHKFTASKNEAGKVSRLWVAANVFGAFGNSTVRLRRTSSRDPLSVPCCSQPPSPAVWVFSTWHVVRFSRSTRLEDGKMGLEDCSLQLKRTWVVVMGWKNNMLSWVQKRDQTKQIVAFSNLCGKF